MIAQAWNNGNHELPPSLKMQITKLKVGCANSDYCEISWIHITRRKVFTNQLTNCYVQLLIKKQKTIKLLKHPKICTVSWNCKIWDLKSHFTAEHQMFICLGQSHNNVLQRLVQQCKIEAAPALPSTALRVVSSPRTGTAGKNHMPAP